MRLPGRLLLGALALVLAIPCGALVLGLGVLLDPATRDAVARLGLYGLVSGLDDLAAGLPPDLAIGALAALAKALALLLLLPPVLVALVGETLRLTSLGWYGGATGLVTAALPLIGRGRESSAKAAPIVAGEARMLGILFAAGAASGLIYWLITRSGRHIEAGDTSTDGV